MKKLIMTLLLFFIATAHALEQADSQSAPQKGKLNYTTMEEKRRGLWKAFHKIRFEKFGKSQEVKLYAEDDSLTRICFICDKGLFIFYWDKTGGRIVKIQHAKMIIYDRINRITFERKRKEGNGAFKLWYYETEELSIGVP
jgi:hypothetical protein